MNQNSDAGKSAPSPKRLVELLQKLADQGITQAEVAARTGLPPQYLSDTKNARRPLTELFARRLAEEFNFNYRWLLGRDSSLDRPLVSASARTGSVWLPSFPHPIEGDPRSHPKWEGACVDLSSIESARLAETVHPYVLRFGHDDKEGRLRKGDLILISQTSVETSEVSVVRYRRKSFLARKKRDKWIRVATGQVLPGDSVVTGHCVGIVWSALS